MCPLMANNLSLSGFCGIVWKSLYLEPCFLFERISWRPAELIQISTKNMEATPFVWFLPRTGVLISPVAQSFSQFSHFWFLTQVPEFLDSLYSFLLLLINQLILS